MNLKEQELTSRMSEIIVRLQAFDGKTDYRYHQTIISIAHDCSNVVKEFNLLVQELRAFIEKDPTKLPPLLVEKVTEYEH